MFQRTAAELEAATKIPYLERIHEEGSKLKGNERLGYIVNNCQRLLVENETRLLGLIGTEEKELVVGNEQNMGEVLQQRNDQHHAREIRKIRLVLVQEALRDIKDIVLGKSLKNSEYYFTLTAHHTLMRLHNLYLENYAATEKYTQTHHLDFEMGPGKLATDLHFYITEFAKLSSDMTVLSLQQKQDHNHIHPSGLPQNKRR